MTSNRNAWFGALSVALVACSAKVQSEGGGSTGTATEAAEGGDGVADSESGADADGGGLLLPAGCPSVAPIPGSACTSPGTACQYDGCTACVCESNGTWVCPAGPGGCASCPAALEEGQPCDVNDRYCPRWAFCGTQCSCYSGVWTCPAKCGGGDCGGSICTGMTTSCPSAKPEEGDSCTAPPMPCQYNWPAGCAQATCLCDSGRWSCSYGETGCGEAGL